MDHTKGNLTDDQMRQYISDSLGDLERDVLAMVMRIILAAQSGLE